MTTLMARDDSGGSTWGWVRGLAVVVAACAAPPDPTVVVTIDPKTISDRGSLTSVVVTATTSAGTVGSGEVHILSTAGSLVDGVTVPLDEFGRATVDFKCIISEDSKCVRSARIAAEWTVGGTVYTGDVSVRIAPPPTPVPELLVEWEDGGSLTPCLTGLDGGVRTCAQGCGNGFTCLDNQCVLNGRLGLLQFTLVYPTDEDLDLHVIEPVADGGVCEVFWSNPNRTGNPSVCGAKSSLDLDSNASCVRPIDAKTENIIYPPVVPLAGTYLVRVDFWKNCTGVTSVPYMVAARAGNGTRYYCGEFGGSEADRGGLGSGRDVIRLRIPRQ